MSNTTKEGTKTSTKSRKRKQPDTPSHLNTTNNKKRKLNNKKPSNVSKSSKNNTSPLTEDITAKTITFKDFPQFRPNLTPRQIFLLGSFGGTYWRPIYSQVTKKNYSNEHKKNQIKKYFTNIPNNYLTNTEKDKSINKYSVTSGTSLEYWESKNWINKLDPYGWLQWYCYFYNGRRSSDDIRQIKRWERFAGPKGRFRRRLINLIHEKNTTFDDFSISPVIRQGLQHWAYQLTKKDCHK